MSKSIILKVTSAFLVGGVLAKAGELVEVTNTEAKDLLSRGKATLATAGDEPAVESAGESEETAGESEGEEEQAGESEETAGESEEKPSKKSKKSK